MSRMSTYDPNILDMTGNLCRSCKIRDSIIPPSIRIIYGISFSHYRLSCFSLSYLFNSHVFRSHQRRMKIVTVK